LPERENRQEVIVNRALYRTKPLREYRVEFRNSDSLVYYIQGGHLFDFGMERVETNEGQLLYIPYGSAYTNYTKTEDTEYYQVDFTLLREGKAYALFDRPMVWTEGESERYLPFIRGLYEAYAMPDPSGEYLCLGELFRIIGQLCRQRSDSERQTRGFRRIEKTVSFLNEFYALDTSVEELAAMSSTCVSNLEKAFKACLGMPPLAYRNKLRMERAKMLLSGGCGVSETCKRVGIFDVYYFSRLFKKYWGISPAAYGKTNRSV